MDLYIPYSYTPYEGGRSYGVFSTREKAEEILNEEKKHGYYETYDITIVQLDVPETF